MTSAHRPAVDRSTVLIALIVAALCGAAIWASGRIATERAIGRIERSANASATLHGALLRSELQKYRLVPLALAGDPEAASVLGTPAPATIRNFDKRLERLNDAIHASAIYLIAEDGTTIAASNWNEADSFVGSNYSFRDYFRRALATGGHEQFALGTVSQHPGLYIARRIRAGGRSGVIVLKVEFDALEQEWRHSGEPAFVAEGRGIVLVTSEPTWRFRSLEPLPRAERRSIRRNLDFGSASLTPLPIRRDRIADHQIIRIADDDAPSPHYVEATKPTAKPGWTLHVLTPIDEAISGAATTARLATAMVCVVIVGLALFVSRRRRAIRQRAADAQAAQIALEHKVDERTRDVRLANEQLKSEMNDRLASEMQLQETRDQLFQANKLASLGQITAGVAHEIAQPVAAIRSYADNGRAFLSRGRDEDASVNFESIVSMTDRIGSITSELRNFSRKARGTAATISLDDAVMGALLLLRDRIARQGVDVDYTPGEPLLVVAERVRLEQVLMNLLGNALDALRDTPSPMIRITAGTRADHIALVIANNGPPLADEVAANLFKPFTSSKEDGLGLGLVISRDIVRELGGDLTLAASDTSVAFALKLKPA
ncbi:sensor histidine kinase [Stakelama saccharophila]|uniref:histidine kinase n=1 Tax=Stakelama saccharophila TaxID=3075605 RepID=A0ABZ0BAE1_9SPHN|nr:ATP-binding protein [Stakelama sp. W311]WNO53636.1 cache domain-containing protein [Stakelama sp. W311]